MRTAWIVFAAGIPLALLSGIHSLGTDSLAQDRGVFDRGVFDRNSDIFGRDEDRSDIPRDVDLLKADDTECQGALLASGLQGASDVQSVGRGEQRIFQVEYQNVPWACLSAKTARSGTMECPDGTRYVRITHQADVAKFECFGRGR
jgi:hypothetical protein